MDEVKEKKLYFQTCHKKKTFLGDHIQKKTKKNKDTGHLTDTG